MLPTRSHSGTLTLLEIYDSNVIRGGKPQVQKMAKILCACTFRFSIPLTRWRHNAPGQCRKCAVRNAKRTGFHGFKPRRSEPPNANGEC